MISGYAEFFFRPRNWFVRFIARLIGAPTCGILRGGPNVHKYGDPYEVSVAFVATDHRNAELKGFYRRDGDPDFGPYLKEARRVLLRHGLTTWFDRRDAQGQIRGRIKLEPE